VSGICGGASASDNATKIALKMESVMLFPFGIYSGWVLNLKNIFFYSIFCKF
jgi:hypothetical protein